MTAEKQQKPPRQESPTHAEDEEQEEPDGRRAHPREGEPLFEQEEHAPVDEHEAQLAMTEEQQ